MFNRLKGAPIDQVEPDDQKQGAPKSDSQKSDGPKFEGPKFEGRKFDGGLPAFQPQAGGFGRTL
ncbi:MAG: hypothetical protein ACREEP_06020 [Dongiaceae bacterium]